MARPALQLRFSSNIRVTPPLQDVTLPFLSHPPTYHPVTIYCLSLSRTCEGYSMPSVRVQGLADQSQALHPAEGSTSSSFLRNLRKS